MPVCPGRSAALVAAAVTVVLITAAATAAGAGLQQANQLFQKGEHERALAAIQVYLAERPKDARGRFLKGLVLAEQNRVSEAIEVFAALTQDFPELPEPYNNLAVLYASQGDYERARSALERAIRTHPSYATAHENLGDIYAKMASHAYDRALQLDRGNTAARTKLNLIGELFPERAPQPVIAARPQPVPKTDVAAAPGPPAATPALKEAVAAAPKPAPAPAPAVKAQPADEAAGARAAPAPEADDEVLRAVREWAAAWSANDVAAYLAHYAPDFRTPKGEPRAAWEAQRKARIAKPRRIEVVIENPRITFDKSDRATVTFRQHYRSDTFRSSVTKTLTLVRGGNRWLIHEERV
jgi:tetratricopeptide (TPR) repeat protein